MRLLPILITTLFALLPPALKAQIEQYNYVGVQTYESGDFTAYHIDFEFFNENIQGRAIVDYGGPDESLYYIRGVYNAQKNILQFKASYLVWTKSDVPQKDYCILDFVGMVKDLKTVKAFSGPYTSSKRTGDSCSNGLLIFTRVFRETDAIEENTEPALAAQSAIIKKTKEEKPLITKNEPTPIAIPRLESTPIKKNENLNIFVDKSTVTLRIYDAGKVDDDRIAITINGEAILDNYAITREPKEIEIILETGKSTVEVTALNEGSKPSNTVKVEIKDGHKVISARTSLKKGEKASLTLIK